MAPVDRGIMVSDLVKEFSWPSPDFSFNAIVTEPQGGERLNYICSGGGVLQLTDDQNSWRPAGNDELAEFAVRTELFMGVLDNKDCYAVQVSNAGTEQFVNLRLTLGNIDSTQFNLAGRAVQLLDWYQGHQFCGQCGNATVDSTHDRSRVCERCRLHYYPRLSPSIIVLVHRDEKILLARNHLFPEGLFSTLAGFVEPGESIEETVRREVFEEVGVTVGNLSYRGSQPWPFPNSLMLGFHAEYESGSLRLQEDEIAEADWFALDDLPLIPGKFAISRWLIDEFLSSRGVTV